MKFSSIHFRYAALALMLGAVCSAPLISFAQNDGTNGPPKVLVVTREFTKPGKDGAAHQKTESAFIHALAAAKASPRYFAMTSLSGPSRALFFSGYPSFAAWEAEEKSVGKDAALSAALDRANAADGDQLSATDQSVWMLREDLSLHMGNLVGVRYMEIRQFMVKPGHMHEWNELVKMYMEGYKDVPEANWAMFQETFGQNSNSFIAVSLVKAGADIDGEMGAGDKGFTDKMGADGMKKMASLEAACVESENNNLFALRPGMSYPPEAWTKAEPDYWKQPKVEAPAKKK